MNLTFEDYVKDLGLEEMSREDQEEALAAVAKTVHTQFLADLYLAVGKEQFNAVKTSIKLGPSVYTTTLKHLVPQYMTLFEAAKQKVFSAIKET